MLHARITNTKTEIRSPAKHISYKDRLLDIAMISSFVVGAIGFFLIVATWESRSVVTYQYESKDGSIFSGVQFKPKEDGTVEIGKIVETPRSIEFDVLETYKVEELFRTETVPISIKVDNITREPFLDGLIVYILSFVIVFLLLPWSSMRKRRRITLGRVLEKL